jgi:ribosomal protein S18 acetylase RimI-like enzyme
MLGDRFFGAWIDESIVGVMSIEAVNDQALACVSSMTVTPSFQRRGVGSALLAMVLTEIGAEPLTVSLELETIRLSHSMWGSDLASLNLGS